jgi:hypothetical protein
MTAPVFLVLRMSNSEKTHSCEGPKLLMCKNELLMCMSVIAHVHNWIAEAFLHAHEHFHWSTGCVPSSSEVQGTTTNQP